jgi:hypothetical protein
MNDSDFFSVDKLVEFGLGLSISQQMVASMNYSLKNSITPGAENRLTPSIAAELFYFAIENQAAGPFTGRETLELIQQGKINKNTLSWKPGNTEWEKMEEMPEILKYIALLPPQLP